MTRSRFLLSGLLGLLVMLAGTGVTFSEEYPSRPITIVVPFAAGGPTDALSRIVAERMRVALGQPVIVENVTGAAGTIALARVARAAADGYTLGVGPMNAYVLTGAFYDLKFDLLRDFEPVALLANNPSVLISRKTIPAKNLAELIAWVRANQGKVSAGTSGVGSGTHVGGILFQNLTHTRLQFVPYRGIAPAMQDVIAGRIDLMFDQISSSLPQIRAGAVKPYAVMAKVHSAHAPEIPTTDEAGLPGFHMAIWHGMWAPKGTPTDIVRRLNAAVVETLADPAVRQRLADIGQEIFPPEQQTPQALHTYHQAEINKWWPIVKAANIKID